MYEKENYKEEFIKDYSRSRVVSITSLYGLFRKIAPYEEKLSKDISKFTTIEALDMYKQFGSRSVYTLMNNNTILKNYYAWMQYHYGIDNPSAYEKITIDDLRPLVDKKKSRILSREEIIEIEDQLLNHSDKAIVELLFIGVSGKNMEDLYAVSEECVKGNKLVVNGKQFNMTNRLKELLPKAFEEDNIMTYGETMKIFQVIGQGRIYKERPNARGVDTDDSRFRYFYRRIMLFRNYLGIDVLTMKNISSSGMIYYLNDGMKKSGLELKNFLRTEEGKNIAAQYGFSDNFYIDNISAKYRQYL